MNVIDDVVVEKSIVVRSEEGDKEKNWIGTSTKEVEEETNTKEEDDDEEKKTREESQTNDNSLAVNIINSKEEDNDDVKNPKDSNKKEDDTEEVETRKRQRAYTESGNKTLLDTDGHEIIGIDGDPKCRLGHPPSHSNEKRKMFDKMSLGPCVYLIPQRVEPEGSWLKGIDWVYHNRKATDIKRQECFLTCVQEYLQVTPNLLTTAASLGLTNLTQYLLEEHHLDPLYNATKDYTSLLEEEKEEEDLLQNTLLIENRKASSLIPNPLQAAIIGGYAQVVKLLSRDNPSMVIDDQGRTVRDYVQMKGSPIRPKDAWNILGIDNTAATETSKLRRRRRRATSYQDSWKEEKHGWNKTAQEPIPEDDQICDIDIVQELSTQDFIQNYYLTGRPILIRNHVPWEELQSFSKEEWSTLEYFHPTKTKFRDGAMAYPTSTNQSYCSLNCPTFNAF